MSKRKRPIDRANKIFSSKWMVVINTWVSLLLLWSIYQTYVLHKYQPIWLVLELITIAIFNWGMWMEALTRAEEKMYGRKKWKKK